MKKISVILILVIAIVSLFGTAYCFADETTELINISDSVSLDIDEILSLYSEEYLSVNENEETVVVVEYNDEDSHSLSADLQLLGVDATTRYTYSYIFNGESISIKLKDISSLTQLSYIKSVSLSNTYYTEEVSESSYEFVSEDATATGEFKNTTAYQGDGMVVAVIDSCFDISHVAFDSITSTDLALSLSDVKDVLYDLNAYELSGETIQNVYKSEKIPFAYDYYESDSDVYSSWTFHGTHVAGIVAGKCSSFTGVVPNAQLVLMKVADENGAMATDTIAAAIEDAIKLGVDIINLSVGAPNGFAIEDSIQYKAVEAAENAGISVVSAAGNQGTSANESRSGTDLAESEYVDNGNVDAPGCYESTVSIANAEETRYFVLNKGTLSETKIQYGQFIASDYSAVYDFTEMCLEYMSVNGITDSLPYIVLSKDDKIALGGGTDGDEVDVSGKIVVVDFDIDTERENDIFDGGAIGVIFVNSESKVSRVKVDGIPAMPLCLVSKESGDALIAAATSKEGVIYVDSDYVKVTIASSSSKGVTGELEFGVDVTGYGTNVYSAALNQSYVLATGTSMASPNVAGVFAVVRQYIKANALLFGVDSDDNIRIAEIATKLIMSNTTLLTDLNDILISPRSQGAGLANIEKAITSLTYISCEDETKTKIELGDNIKDTITLSFKIENYDSNAKDYELTVALLTELLQDGYLSGYEKELSFTIDDVQNITISGNKYLVHVDANSTLQVSLTLTISEESIEYLDQFENGIYLEGYIILDDSGNTMSCPFIGFYGDWDSQDVLDLTIYEESEDNKAYLRASVVYGNYADSYYFAMGAYVFSVSDKYDGEKPAAQEEFAALSIYSSAMYATGYFRLGLLRNADYIEVQLVNTQTGEITSITNYTYTQKMRYNNNYDAIVCAEDYLSISPYTLNLYNNEQYELVFNVYRTYDFESDNNEITDTYTQKFYVDEESPEIDNIVATEEDGKKYATITLSDNHYIQALGVCVGSGSSVTNVTLTPEDFYPVATEATGVGQSVTLKVDVTDTIANATNGYLYFYVVDYAFNTNIYYYSIKNWSGESVDINSKNSSSSTSSSSRPQTEKQTTTTIEFTSTDIDVFVNKEVDLANTTYVANYSVNEKYTWSVSDSSILAMDNGKITGLQEGICIVTIKDSKDNESTLIVKVQASEYESATYEKTNISGYEMVDTINGRLDPAFTINTLSSRIGLAPGESLKFTYSYSPYNYNYIQNPITITMTTSDPSIASVENNIIKAVSEGQATVTVFANGEEIKSYTIYVAPSVFVNDDGVLLACFSDETTIDLSSSSNIVAIGANAFTYAPNVQTIILPTSCVCIYSGTFKNNTTLTTITNLEYVSTIQESAFEGCTSLTSVNLSNAKSIGANAFKGCTSLEEVILDSTIVEYASIDTTAFIGCTKLATFNISGTEKTNLVVNGELRYILNTQTILSDNTITSIGEYVFSNINVQSVDLSTTSITRIEANAFAGNTILQKVVLPKTLTYVGNNAFKGCTRLSTVEFKKSTTEDRDLFIGSYAFVGTNVQSIDLSKLRTTIKDYAFAGCTNLSYANVGIVQEMGKYTFAITPRLIKVEFEDGTKDLGTYTFAYITENSTTYYHKMLREVVVPSSVEKIGTAVFAGCTSLSVSKISFDNIKEIGDYAFHGCINISTLDLPSVEKIGYAAFAETALQSITINSEMEEGTLTIGALAFYECGNLETVVLPKDADVSIEINKGAFYNCSSLPEETTKKTTDPRTRVTTESKVGINLDRVTIIGDYAFTGCESITSLALESCKEIGYAAFADCKNVATISIPVLEKLCDAALYNTAIKSITLPETLKSIGQAAFCNTSVSIEINSNKDYTNSCIVVDKKDDEYILYTKLSDGTLMLVYYPQSLTQTKYEVLDNTSTIGEYACIGNKSLIAVTLPASLKSIGHGAFYGCENLTAVTYKGTTLPKLLATYSSSASSIYCNFIGYNQDDVAIVLYVENEEMQNSFSANKTWSTLCDYILVSGETNNIVNFMIKYNEVGSNTVTESNKSDFEELKNLYEALSDDEKEALANLTTGEDAVTTYNKRLKEYNSLVSTNTSKIIVDLAQSSGLEEWVIITIIAIIGAALIAGAITTIVLVQKRRKNLRMIQHSSNDKKNIEDIFGVKDENVLTNEDVFRDYYKEPKIEGTNDQDNEKQP